MLGSCLFWHNHHQMRSWLAWNFWTAFEKKHWKISNICVWFSNIVTLPWPRTVLWVLSHYGWEENGIIWYSGSSVSFSVLALDCESCLKKEKKIGAVFEQPLLSLIYSGHGCRSTMQGVRGVMLWLCLALCLAHCWGFPWSWSQELISVLHAERVPWLCFADQGQVCKGKHPWIF